VPHGRRGAARGAPAGAAAGDRGPACLLALRTPGYGYALLKTLEAAGIPSDANTIYPLLRRLEERGLLESEWNTAEARPRKFYRTSPAGAELARQLMTDMTNLGAALRALNGGA
jgi:DNA-binding PadR family transcriptional regulator